MIRVSLIMSLGIALQSGSPLRKKINLALLKIEEDGTYSSIYSKYFGEL
jgi:ABC-type amino acid transport substrate-binding protein